MNYLEQLITILKGLIPYSIVFLIGLALYDILIYLSSKINPKRIDDLYLESKDKEVIKKEMKKGKKIYKIILLIVLIFLWTLMSFKGIYRNFM